MENPQSEHLGTHRAMNGEEPGFKKRRIIMTTIQMLPDDLLFDILSRLSRLYYPTLSLVSKRFRSVLASTELYQTRTLLGRTESCLYVCLRIWTNSEVERWFTLCQKPRCSKKFLLPVPSPSFPSATTWSKAVAIGPNIYATGGYDSNYKASSSVMVMDCRSHTCMQVARVHQSACVLDERIYVVGGREYPKSTNWMEVFDTKTQTWDFLQIPGKDIICIESLAYNSVGYEGTLYVNSLGKNETYKLYKGRWREVRSALHNGWASSSSHCVIQNVFFRYYYKKIDWYDSKQRLWIELSGLDRLPRFPFNAHVQMVDSGGKLSVFWEEIIDASSEEKNIWCAGIAIGKQENEHIWGLLEWFDVVYTTKEQYNLVSALATTI